MMKVANIFLLLITVIILACYVEVYGPEKSSTSSTTSSSSDTPSISSSSQIIALQEPLLYQEQSYRTIRMGSTIWLAENLNAIPKSGKSWCNGNLPNRCKLYGKLYDWEAAMSVCPDKWKLPSKEDFDNLADFGPDILSTNAAWWNATFGGFKEENTGDYEGFSDLDKGYWWSSTESKNLVGYGSIEGPGRKLEYNYMTTKERAFSVRCVKK